MSQEAAKRHVSQLADPRMRFLARVVDHTLQDGFRTPEDFLRHFPPAAIVSSLSADDELRVKLLVATTGTHEKIALKKSVASASEDLALALEEGTTTPAALVGLYPSDDKIRHLDPKKLWAFVAEDGSYKALPQDAVRHARASARIAFILDCALQEGLLSLRDIADGMTFDEIASSLPEPDVRDVVKHALTIARAGSPLTEEHFMAVVPLPQLVFHVRLEHTWERVVIARVAAPAAFVETEPAAAGPAEAPAVPPPSEAPAPESSILVVPSPPSAAAESGREDDPVRRRTVERLRGVERLPPSHAQLGTPILLSIESMYADIWATNDDEERELIIRESFPNETHLRTALLALIELLDPSVDTRDPIIRDADVSGLVKIVLFEERRRREAAPASAPKKALSAPGRARRSVPPPLPRTSNTPPPFPKSEPRSSPPPLPAEAAQRRER